MEMIIGACRFVLWYVVVHWDENTVYRIKFSRTGEEGLVPLPIRMYLSGKTQAINLESVATQGQSIYARIYREVRKVPYAETATYGEIARIVGTGPRVVGLAMAHNPTPLVIPCHRIVGTRSLGGFSSGIDIKIALLELEKKHQE